MEPTSTFGAWLKARRRQLDLTQELLAEQVGCSVDLISKLERALRRPSRELAARLLDQLQVPAAEQEALLALARHSVQYDVPAAVASQPAHSNLPALPTPLLGRDETCAALAALLRQPDARLVTLSGPGGVGKTQLSLQVAASLLEDFPDGIFLVPLAPVRDAALVAATIAQSVGVRIPPAQPVAEALQAALRSQRLLLVVDNFEHLTNAAPLLSELLAHCSQLAMLVTSREALRLRGERVVPVAPLPVPDPQQLPPLAELARIPSIQLFVRCAQAVQPDFALSEANALTIAAICRQLDGLPLAIELAAARTMLFTLDALLHRLSSRLSLLVDGARDLPLRQQTMRDAIAWSYELLAAPEQRLFRWLGVFVGGATLEAAMAVCATAGDTEAGIGSLVQKSLLRREANHSAGAGEPRIGMLELLREYALEQLVATGELDAAQQAHAQFFLRFAERAASKLHGAEQTLWVQRLAAEVENIRAVLAWSRAAPGRHEVGLRLAGALWWFWAIRNRAGEWQHELYELLEASAVAATPARASALLAAGKLSEFQGDSARAEGVLAQALALYRELGDGVGEADALLYLGRVARNRGEYVHATTLEQQSLAVFERANHSEGVVWSLLGLGDIALDQGAFAQAAHWFEQARAASVQRGDRGGEIAAVSNLGRVAYHQGRFELARQRFDACLVVFDALDSRWGDIVYQLGRLAHTQGQYEQALAWYRESLEQLRDFGDLHFLALCLEGIAGLCGATGHGERAAQLFGAAATCRNRARAPRRPVNQPDYERDLATAQAASAADTWQRAWDAGSTLAWEGVARLLADVSAA